MIAPIQHKVEWKVPKDVRELTKITTYISKPTHDNVPIYLKYNINEKYTGAYSGYIFRTHTAMMNVLNRVHYYRMQARTATTFGLKDVTDHPFSQPGAYGTYIDTIYQKSVCEDGVVYPFIFYDLHLCSADALHSEDIDEIHTSIHDDYEATVEEYIRYKDKLVDGFSLVTLLRFDKFEIIVASKMGTHVDSLEVFEVKDDTTPMENRVYVALGHCHLNRPTIPPLRVKKDRSNT